MRKIYHIAFLGLATSLATTPSVAQMPPSPAPPPPPIVKDSDPNKPLSDKLNESEGVLTPDSTADSKMQIIPPPSASPMPVIPPPGEPGGDQRIQPK